MALKIAGTRKQEKPIIWSWHHHMEERFALAQNRRQREIRADAFFSSSWIEIAWLWLRWWIVQLLTSSSLFLGWKCATLPRPEVKWQWKPPSITWCISVLPRTKLFSLFLNIEKVLQTTATTNGSETHSCQPKSQAAKSKWAKIETGLSLGNRWEMFYFMPGLGRGRARRRRHQL